MASQRIIVAVLRWGVKMAIDHEAHKIRIKAVSDKMNHPMEYNDAGAPKESVRAMMGREQGERRIREEPNYNWNKDERYIASQKLQRESNKKELARRAKK